MNAEIKPVRMIAIMVSLLAIAAPMLTQVANAQDAAQIAPIVIQSNRYTTGVSTWDHERAARIANQNSTTSVGSTFGAGATDAGTNATGGSVHTNRALVAQPSTVVTGGQPPCSAQAVTWTVAGATCNATTPLIISGESASVSDPTAPTTGSALFACNAGAASVQPGATCVATCAGGPVSWANGSSVCASTAPSLVNGQSTTVASTNGVAGSASLTCTASGAMSLSPISCTPPAPVRDWFLWYTCCTEFKGQQKTSWAMVHITQTGPAIGGGYVNNTNPPFEDSMYYYNWSGTNSYHVYTKTGVIYGFGYTTYYENCQLVIRNYGGSNLIGYLCVKKG